MQIDDQPRELDGQYGEKVHSHPEVSLVDAVDGSFLFPPNEWPGGVAQYIDFWKTQPISDETLVNFASAYATVHDEWWEPRQADAMDIWGNSKEALDLQRQRGMTRDRLSEIRRAKAEEIKAALDAEYPERIPQSLVRYVARAAQMHENRDSLRDESDQAAVLGVEVYRSQKGNPWTVGEIWDAWKLGAIMPDALYSRDVAVERRLRALAGRIG